MSRRFFADAPITTDLALLKGAEAHHLIHVMRASVGTTVTLFDGTGWEFSATVQQLGRNSATLRVNSSRVVDRELPFVLVLAVALPRGERQEWLVEKAVELGVTRLVPWLTERSVARPNPQSRERLRRTVIEASKQCGRNRLMEIDETQEFASYMSQQVDRPSLLAHVGADDQPVSQIYRVWEMMGPLGVQLGIGPEGGLTDRETQEAMASGWQLVNLGPRILRSETAALALAARLTLF
jgi:16S rRNA (uracil1498-N3)-methyltransferase